MNDTKRITPEHATRIARVARRDAEDVEQAAGHNGAMHDGGAIRMLVDAWEAGLEGRVPNSLRDYATQAKREADPDWAEYQRLKAKFG